MHMADSVADQHGYVNNAGRFRSELHYNSYCTRKKHSPSTCSDTLSFDYGKSAILCESVEQELFEFGKDGDSPVISNDTRIDTSDLDGVCLPPPTAAAAAAAATTTTTHLASSRTSTHLSVGQGLTDTNSPGKSGSFQSDPFEDFYLFDFLPYTAGSVGSNPPKSLNNPVHLENPERETRWYFKYFLGKYHQLYCGYVTERDPFLLAVAKTDVQSYGVSQYRAILWRKTGSQKLCISHNPTNSLTAKKVLNFFDLHKVEKGPKEVLNFEVQKDALTLEEQEGSVNFKFGVVYCIEGQTSDEQMYNNEHGSEEFDQFVNLLGDRIHLKSWDRFKGGLDTKSNTTGIDSVYTVYEGHEIMFHVSTLLPFSTDNRQQIERKRHVGNDIVNIIFVDGVAPDSNPSWMPSMMKTHFTPYSEFCGRTLNILVNLQIFLQLLLIVKKRQPIGKFTQLQSDNMRNFSVRLNVFAEESVPIFGPALPNPAEFTSPQEFREFLLVKLINGEKAAFHSPVFAQKRERTFEMLLQVICNTNMNDSTSGAICRRAFSDVIVDSLNGITTGKEQSRNDIYIRFGQVRNTFRVTGREARIAVIQLGDIDSGQAIDRNQLKKLSLDKTKGCHLFALSKSIVQPLRLAVVVHRRILIYQWQLITGRSLSSWNQFAQAHTPDSFQLIRELPILEPIQTLCFLEGIPGGRLCVGHRHNFELIDERTKEAVQLFRSEGSRNQVVSAHEVWDDEDPELLLCFTRTCHFQKLSAVQSVVQPVKKTHMLQSNSTDNSFTQSALSTQHSVTESAASSTSVPSTGFYTGSSSPSVSLPIATGSSPDMTSGSSLLLSSPTEEKQRISEFDFTWNFESKKVVVSHPYIFAFTSTSIEIRLVNNGSLVHTMLVPDCRLISSKTGLYFSSTSENLDNTSTFSNNSVSGRTGQELLVSKKTMLLNNVPDKSSEKDSEDSPRQEEADQQPEPSNHRVNKRSPNFGQVSSSNSSASLPLSPGNSPPVNCTDSTPAPKPRYIYRILYNSVPSGNLTNTNPPETSSQRKNRQT
ncbi:GARL3 [Fasciola gigantica]|uniref:GARL3 n=1 Tax=Fasciola gigantica TaxID=46835 RepID=A0A504XFB9_FASGI|nr:GARL3 [Fasciola gigantica]